ncbi:hypothetical protein AWZ03_015369, partial [Drosophila navojoa]
SYNYEGVIIPSHYVGTFDHIYTSLVDHVAVAPHERGCICKLRPCLNICCPKDQINENNLCTQDISTVLRLSSPMINVTLSNGSVQSVNIYEQFVAKSFRPCTVMFLLAPEFQLYENGTLLSGFKHFDRNDFCLMLNDSHELKFIVSPINCDISNGDAMQSIAKLAMLFSIPFLLLTIAVYLLIPELRNQHG